MTLKSFASDVAPVVLWAGLIFVLSNQPVLPGFEISILDFLLKKLGHIFVYFVLYLLTWRALYNSTQQKKALYSIIIPVIFCFAFAVSDEIHQSFIPNRFPSLRDVGFDMVGVTLGILKTHRYI